MTPNRKPHRGYRNRFRNSLLPAAMVAAAVLMACIALLSIGATEAQALVVYYEDFEDNSAPEWTGGGTIQGTQGYSGVSNGSLPGFGNLFLRNSSVGGLATASTLRLTGLAAHTHFSVDFLFAAIDSWDGNHATYGPDFFVARIDGGAPFGATFNNFDVNGDTNTVSPISFGVNLGFNNSFPDSAYYDLSPVAYAHTASTLTIDLYAAGAGWQGGDDESWALDTIKVDLECRFGGATVCPGSSSEAPLLPVIDPEDFSFDFLFDARADERVFIDPIIAVGYDYIINSGPNIASVLLPTIAGDDGAYEIFLWDGDGFDIFLDNAFAGVEYAFDVDGVDRFRVLGIDQAALLDPLNPVAFVTGLTFVSAGTVDMSMIPVTFDTDAVNPGPTGVPEPMTLSLLGAGLAGIGMARRRRA